MRRLMLMMVLGLLPSLAHAVPIKVPYSGQLSEGGTLVTGTRNFSFVIYAAPSGGTGLYFQSEPLMVTAGVYHTMLNIPSQVWDGSDRYLGVFVEGTPITPRVQIGSVPYAARTGLSDRATIGNFLSTGALSHVQGGAIVNIPSTAWTEVASRTVTLPSDGLVLAQATGKCNWSGTGSPPWSVQFILTETTPSTHQLHVGATSSDDLAYAVGQVIPLPAGTHTIKLYARNYVGSLGGTNVHPNLFTVITFLTPAP